MKIKNAFLTVSRVVISTLILLAFCEIALRIVVHVKQHSIDLPRLIPDLYKNEPWAYTLAEEKLRTRVAWQPYVYWRAKPFSGKMITISPNGLRKTWNHFDNKPLFRIFMFGGSTMNGALRDDDTIPSQLSRKLYNLGYRGIEVVNFGQGGYVNTQEMLAFLFELRSGNTPNAAIFYDGINDVFSRIQQGEAGLAENEQNRVDDLNASRQITFRQVMRIFHESQLYRFSQKVASYLPPKLSKNTSEFDHARTAKEIVDTYFFNRGIIELVAKKYGIQMLYFWQPTFFDKPQLSEYEKKSEKTYPFYIYPDIYQKSSRLISERILSEKIPNVKNISAVFKDSKNTIFLDTIHVSEEGDGMIAAEMLKNLSLPTSLKTRPQ